MKFRDLRPLALFFAGTLVSLGFMCQSVQSDLLECDRLIDRGEVWYTSETGQPYDGNCVSYYSEGNLQSEASFKQGLLTGPLKLYYRSGAVEEIVEHTGGVPDGDATYYYESGIKRRQGKLIQAQAEGLWHTWYPNGDLEAVENWRDGVMEDSSFSRVR